MPRAPFQVLVFPYAVIAGAPRYAVFQRADCGAWQGLSGGGEDDETPEQAARREAAEEGRVPTDARWTRLDAVGQVPATELHERAHWPPALTMIPEYSFGVAVAPEMLMLSDEHTAVEWLACAEALRRLTWDSNRVALDELHDRLAAAHGPLGLSSGAVHLVPADATWPFAFAIERERLLAALGHHRAVIEHVGSTAVPGLTAKPILDIMVGRPAGSELAPYVAAFEGGGYQHRGEYGIPGRDYFVRDDAAGRRTHHLHMVEHGSAFWRVHLAFRDALRRVPERAAAYASLKQELAARHLHDRAAYTDGKTAFIAETLAMTTDESRA